MFEPQAGKWNCRLPNFIQCANLSCLLHQLNITLSILLLRVDFVFLYVQIPDPLFYSWHSEVLAEKRTQYICTIPCYICTPFLSLAKTLVFNRSEAVCMVCLLLLLPRIYQYRYLSRFEVWLSIHCVYPFLCLSVSHSFCTPVNFKWVDCFHHMFSTT